MYYQDRIGKEGVNKCHLDKRVLRECEFFHDSAANQMLLNNPFQNFRRARVVPNRFRINDRDWPVRADAQAVGFGAIDQPFRAGEFQFFKPLLQELPGRQALFFRSAFSLGLIGAEKNMSLIFLHAVGFRRRLQFADHISSDES